jgi:hypothetical protein
VADPPDCLKEALAERHTGGTTQMSERTERRSFLRPVQSAWKQALEAFRVEVRERLDRERPDCPDEEKEEIERRALTSYEEGLRKLVGRSSAEQESLAARLLEVKAGSRHRGWDWRRLVARLPRVLSSRR